MEINKSEFLRKKSSYHSAGYIFFLCLKKNILTVKLENTPVLWLLSHETWEPAAMSYVQYQQYFWSSCIKRLTIALCMLLT